MLQNNIHNKHVNYTELEESKGHWECWVQYGAVALFNGDKGSLFQKKTWRRWWKELWGNLVGENSRWRGQTPWGGSMSRPDALLEECGCHCDQAEITGEVVTGCKIRGGRGQIMKDVPSLWFIARAAGDTGGFWEKEGCDLPCVLTGSLWHACGE